MEVIKCKYDNGSMIIANIQQEENENVVNRSNKKTNVSFVSYACTSKIVSHKNFTYVSRKQIWEHLCCTENRSSNRVSLLHDHSALLVSSYQADVKPTWCIQACYHPTNKSGCQVLVSIRSKIENAVFDG